MPRPARAPFAPRVALALPALLAAGLAAPLPAQDGDPQLAYYLPDDVAYDRSIPTPASELGWEVGKWHARPDQIVDVFETIAAASPRVVLETYGRTHEDRPLLLATVTSTANHARIDELRAAHVEAARSGAEAHDGPAVVWMGYSVHGNEPSGAQAAMLLLYHLAAATGDEVEALLEDTVVLIDPAINPDGVGRFAQWANSHKGYNLVGDSEHREHREVWPGGRTNHYWFDLNRDWLLLTHPESRARIERYQAWLPHVLTDFHEMGTNSTYFFQPGIPSRRNPITPVRNEELTREIARFHAAALDSLGSLYYTEESFDDFYYGKGSTYPDVQGSIGILFEQASSRGHYQESEYGGIDFPFTIRNQFTASLSTLEAVDALRGELSAYQRGFYRSAAEEAAEHPVAAYVLGAPEDPVRTRALLDLLDRHAIAVHALAGTVEAGGESFEPGAAWIVPVEQPQFRLIRASFETRTSWDDNSFYDVSSWTLPLSFDVPYAEVGRGAFGAGLLGERWTRGQTVAGSLQEADAPVAWLFEWHRHSAPRALARLLEAGVRARVATEPFSVATASGERGFDRGTIVVPRGIQELEREALLPLLRAAAGDGLDVHAALTGLTFEGVDLGSSSLERIEAPEVLLLVGSGVSAYEAGEAWHHFDVRLDMPVTMVERASFARLDLDRYTHVLLVSGATGGFGDREEEALREWLREGGVLVTTRGSASWAARRFLDNGERRNDDGPDDDAAPDEAPDAETPDAQDPDSEIPDAEIPDDETAGPTEEAEPESPPTYADYEDLAARERVAGTIFQVRLDRTHPLAFGFGRDTLPVFRSSTSTLPEAEDPLSVPARYTDAPLLSGFASDENVAEIAGTPAVRVERVGRGTVVCLADDPLFRGVWYGTDKLLSNAIFFGGAVKFTRALDGADDDADDDGHGH